MSNYCSSCGLPIPEGQGKCCSMCYGDPDYGRDGYYRSYLENWREEQEESAREEENSHREG